ncbi:MAG: carbohydrate ABC transporter permease [Paracoccaceae bacterium]
MITEDMAARRKSLSAMERRKRINMAFFLGPAVLVIGLFFVVPVMLDIAISFTDLGRDLKVSEFSTNNYERALGVGDTRRDRQLPGVIARTVMYVGGTLLIFNTTFGLILALTTTAVPSGSGTFFRAVWLLPRMSPSVVYAILWIWSIHGGDTSLVNQVLMGVFGATDPIDLRQVHPMWVIIIANGFIGASFAMIILTSAIRGIPDHLFYAARCDGAGPLSLVRHITLPQLRWPLTYIVIWQTLSLMTSFEYILLITGGGPFRATTVYAIFIFQRAFGASGQYAYGAALAFFLIVPGVVLALILWRVSNMRNLMQQPRIEVH